MKTTVPLLAAFAVLFLGASAHGDPVKNKKASSAKNILGVAKTDFHVKIESDSPMNVQSSNGRLKEDPQNNIAGTVTGSGTTTLTIDWDVNTAPGNTFGYVIEATQDEWNQMNVTGQWYTPRNSPTDAPGLGFRVEPNGDFYLSNDMVDDILFSNLYVDINITETPTSDIWDLILDDTAPSGSLSAVISSGTEYFVGNFEIAPREFLTAHYLSSFVTGDSVLTAEEFIEHEHQIPAPSPAALLALSGLILAKRRR
jgi:hypothetical protein